MSAEHEGRNAEDIQRDVLEELTWDARVQPHEIGVSVRDGVVTLTGWMDGYARKWAAERAAHRVRGVVAVANDIEVPLPRSGGAFRCRHRRRGDAGPGVGPAGSHRRYVSGV